MAKMTKEEFFEKYKVSIAFVGGCILVAIIVCSMLSSLGAQERVVFSVDGVPHCPYCNTVVMPYTGYCENCKRAFKWTNRIVTCPRCNGSGQCQTCLGIGKNTWYDTTRPGPPMSADCWECVGSVGGSGKLYDGKMRGKCPVCEGKGYIIYGKAPVQYWENRPDLRKGAPQAPRRQRSSR